MHTFAKWPFFPHFLHVHDFAGQTSLCSRSLPLSSSLAQHRHFPRSLFFICCHGLSPCAFAAAAAAVGALVSDLLPASIASHVLFACSCARMVALKSASVGFSTRSSFSLRRSSRVALTYRNIISCSASNLSRSAASDSCWRRIAVSENCSPLFCVARKKASLLVKTG